jgi:RNA polymerase sigma factor (sigma-70 family)
MKNLESKTDQQLIRRVQNKNCEESLKILINRHSPLCYKIYKKYTPSFNVKNIDLNEVYQQKDYIIYKTVISYKSNKKVKFSTWLGNQIRYQCLNAINKKEDIIYLEQKKLQFLIDKNNTEDKTSKLVELKEYIITLLDQLKDERISKIFNMRYFQNTSSQTWTKIGKKMKMSTQNAINLHNKGVQILKNKLTSKDLFDKI